MIPDDAALDDYFEELHENRAWPTGPVEYVGLVEEDQTMQTTPKPNIVEEGRRHFGGPSPQSRLLFFLFLVSVRS